MKFFFYAPFKPIDHPNPSGDRTIARSLFKTLNGGGDEAIVYSSFRSVLFYQSPVRVLIALWNLLCAVLKNLHFNADVFFTYHVYYKSPDIFGPILSMVFRKPYIIYQASYSQKPLKNWKTKFGYYITKFALKRASLVFSNNLEDWEGLNLVVPKEKLKFVNRFIDRDLFSRDEKSGERFRVENKIPQDSFVVTCTAMLRADRKTEGVLFLIDCLNELRNEGLDFHFVLIGAGKCFEHVKETANKHFGTKSHCLGLIERNQIYKIYSGSNIFAFPGIEESFGMVYVEAQSCGLPAVAFDNDGVPQAIDNNSSGFLSKFMDKEDYKSKLRSLINDKNLRDKMSKAAVEFVKTKFDKETNELEFTNNLKSLK